MGRAFITSLANIDFHGTEGVDGESLVGVDGNTEKARVGVDKLINVSDNRVPQNTGITKEGKISHVIRAVKLGRVDLADKILLEDLDLSINLDGDLGTILGLQKTLEVTAISLVRDPHRLLGVIRLGLVLHLDLVRDQKPWGGVGVGTGGLLDMSRHFPLLM